MQVELMSSKYAHYSPTGGQRMLADLKHTAKMALTRKTSKVGANSALNGLGEFSWTGLLQSAASGLVQNRITELQSNKEAADQRLARAEADARAAAKDASDQKNAIISADAAAARSLGAQRAGFFSQPKNVALVGGGLAAIVITFLALKKKGAV